MKRLFPAPWLSLALWVLWLVLQASSGGGRVWASWSPGVRRGLEEPTSNLARQVAGGSWRWRDEGAAVVGAVGEAMAGEDIN